MKQHVRYNFGSYIHDNIFQIVAILAFGIFMTFMLVVMQVTVDAIMLLDTVFIFLLLGMLLFGYYRRFKFWNEVMAVSESIDKVEHFESLIQDPTFLDGMVAKESIDNLLACAISEITDLKSDKTSHSRYIEQWVHEVKTPLAASKLILNQMHGNETDALKREIERTERLVEQALYAAKSDSLSKDYLISDVGLNDLVRGACKSNMQLLTTKNISLSIQIDSDLMVLADKMWLEFILSQILVNSAKYDAANIEFIVKQNDSNEIAGETILEIKDDGCGIPAEDVPRVFDRGFTGEVGRAHGSATGMGLYLAAIMCSKMGIGISLSSEEGVGTRVNLSFPHDNRMRDLLKNLH